MSTKIKFKILNPRIVFQKGKTNLNLQKIYTMISVWNKCLEVEWCAHYFLATFFKFHSDSDVRTLFFTFLHGFSFLYRKWLISNILLNFAGMNNLAFAYTQEVTVYYICKLPHFHIPPHSSRRFGNMINL